MALTIFEDTFGRQRVRYGKVRKSSEVVDYLVDVSSAVQSVVDTFKNPVTGKRYVVSMSDRTEAFTKPTEQVIVVSHQPILDKSLRVSVACTIMTGLVFHEIGHTLFDIPFDDKVKAAFGDRGAFKGWGTRPYDQLAHTLMNLGGDARLEVLMAQTLPVAKDIFPTMLHWLALRVGMVGKHWRWTGSDMKMAERVNFAGTAMRYPWTAVWSKDAATREERAWWQDWKRRYVALAPGDTLATIDLVYEGLDRLRHPLPGAEVDPPIIDCPIGPPGPTPKKGDKPDPKGKGEGKGPGVPDEDEDEDEPKTGKSPASDFEDDPDDEPNPGGDDEDGDEDEDDEGEGNPGIDDEDEDDESEPEPGDDDGGDEGEPPTGTVDPDPQSDKPVNEEFEQDFDAHDITGSIDALNHGNDGSWEEQKTGSLTQTILDGERTTERIKSSQWGTAKVGTVDLNARLRSMGYRR